MMLPVGMLDPCGTLVPVGVGIWLEAPCRTDRTVPY